MKKVFVTIVFVVFVVEVILFVQIRRGMAGSPGQGKKNNSAETNDAELKKQVEAIKTENRKLEEHVTALQAEIDRKQHELDEKEKANEVLRKQVEGGFGDLMKKLTDLDNQRKAELAEAENRRKSETEALSRQIENEKKTLAETTANLNSEIAKRDGIIEQTRKSLELTERVLNEEREQVKVLNEKLTAETKKSGELLERVGAVAGERDSLHRELEAEQKKNADLMAENETLKKKIEELSRATGGNPSPDN